jgi:5-oxoprolinase (ATP-hydrolysing) subunit A
MAFVELNCDMGEAFGIYDLGADDALWPHITLANVACGFHAGDPAVMQRTVHAAREHGVRVGAHPSYPDLQGFGRREMEMDRDELTATIVYQVGALKGFLYAAGMELAHIKPHGALYGRAARDEQVALAIADAAESFGVPLLGMAGTLHESVYTARGLGFLAEYYADLDYDDDGGLLITRKHVAYDPDAAARRVARVVQEGVAVSASGKEFPMRADCVCVHSDTPGAAELARAVAKTLRRLEGDADGQA